MYEPFKFDMLLKERNMAESFNLDLDRSSPIDTVFTEAVFIGGRETMKPVTEAFEHIKAWLDAELKDKGNKFDAYKFVKNIKFKELEDALIKVFGFRNVAVMCSNNKYDAKSDKFHDETMNCYTWPTWRYTIDGLVTDKGFYDSTHSINTEVVFTLGLMRELSAEECVSILLHEIGHNIDPALVDINYTKTNAISKYLTDRKNKLSDREKKSLENGKMNFVQMIVIIGGWAIIMFVMLLARMFQIMFFDKEKAIAQIKEQIRHDEQFGRVTNQEAFADNFARMYGFGAFLISSMNKLDKKFNNARNSTIKREKERQWVVAKITQASIADVHKTDMHRIHSLIKEYEADLKDPSIPAAVKKSIAEDLEEVKLILDSFLHDRKGFQERVNQIIYDELQKADIKFEKRDKAKADDKGDKKSDSIKESGDILDAIICD